MFSEVLSRGSSQVIARLAVRHVVARRQRVISEFVGLVAPAVDARAGLHVHARVGLRVDARADPAAGPAAALVGRAHHRRRRPRP